MVVLLNLIEYCEYGDIFEIMLSDRIVFGIWDQKI